MNVNGCLRTRRYALQTSGQTDENKQGDQGGELLHDQVDGEREREREEINQSAIVVEACVFKESIGLQADWWEPGKQTAFVFLTPKRSRCWRNKKV